MLGWLETERRQWAGPFACPRSTPEFKLGALVTGPIAISANFLFSVFS